MKFVLNSEITNEDLKYHKMGIKYHYDKFALLKDIIPEYLELANTSSDIKYRVISNALVESTLLTIRIEYDFFFKYEKLDNDVIKFNKSFSKKNSKDDLVAEYYFSKPEQWIEVKIKNSISFEQLQSYISSDDLNKNSVHFTAKEKKLWDIIPVINYLIYINEIFFEHADKWKTL